MDTVFLKNFSVRGKHGVDESERHVEQEFIIDIEAQFDASSAVSSDKLEDTVDYANFRTIAREAVEGNSFYLIEKLADTIARRILQDARIQSVSVCVRKPAVFKDSQPGITIVRTK